MGQIIPDIIALVQYKMILLNQAVDRPNCLNCGKASPWRHGGYVRKADRFAEKGHSPSLVYIQRYYCFFCKKTCSVLPECIPRRRWYLWSMQQAVLLLLLSGESVRSISKTLKPSRHTLARWRNWFMEKLVIHKGALCHLYSELGRTDGFASFWQACLEKMPLSKAMRLCHESGVDVP